MGVIISDFVGLLLLPVYSIFERFRGRGWQAYLPAGLVAGVLFSMMDGPPHFGRPLTYYVLCGLCGTLCAGVFFLRIRAIVQKVRAQKARSRSGDRAGRQTAAGDSP